MTREAAAEWRERNDGAPNLCKRTRRTEKMK